VVARVVKGASVALVTGSASGIGLATVRRAGELGYIPVGFDIASRRPDDEAASSAGGRVAHVDVTDPSAVRIAVDDVEREVGPVALAIGAAGVLIERPFGSIDEELWDLTLEVHLGGIYNLTVAVMPAFAERGEGSIVAISSELAFLGAEGHVHYVAAKAAVVGFMRAAARELARDGIRVNCVAPGPTDTPLLGPSGRDPSYVERIVLRRLGRPEEVAQAILDVSRWPWATGQLFGVNGGAVIR
jgi:NAD(P)-dependent dehydrogenase (short-subunit alcohol dehydrogenase family)